MMNINNPAAVEKLRLSLSTLAPNEQQFASSLVSQFKSKGYLSSKQWPFVHKLYEKTQVKAAPVDTSTQPKIENLSSIVTLFDGAKENGLKFPKIRFGHEDHSIVLSVAGPQARMPGTINVVCDEVWVGRVTRDGAYLKSSRDESPINVVEVLTKLAENPVEEMELYGKRTGNCCLCGRELTNHTSIDRGIGPICIQKWGL